MGSADFLQGFCEEDSQKLKKIFGPHHGGDEVAQKKQKYSRDVRSDRVADFLIRNHTPAGVKMRQEREESRKPTRKIKKREPEEKIKFSKREL